MSKRKTTPHASPTKAQSPQAEPPRDGTRPATLQDFADGFSGYVRTATEVANRFAYRPDDPELAPTYLLYRGAIGNWGMLMRRNFPDAPALPELPTLDGTSFHAGMIHLAQFCERAAGLLLQPDAPPVLCEDALKILRWLGGRTAYTKQITIADSIEKSKDTVSTRLVELRGLGFTTQNKRTGEAITPKGREYLQSPPD